MNGHLEEHNSNGKGGRFWYFNLGHLLLLLSMCAGGISWFVVYDRQINANSIGLIAITEAVRKLADQVSFIDDHGTHSGQMNDHREDEALSEQKTRIEALETTAREVIPKITRIEIKLDDLIDTVKSDKEEKKT